MNTAYQAFVTIGWWEILVTICNTLITFLIVKRFLFQPVRRMISAREEQINTMLIQAESDRKAAEKIKQEYTDALSGARKEADAIVSSAVDRAAQRTEEMERETRREIAEMKHRAEVSIERERQKAMHSAVTEIADLSVMIAAQIIGREVSVKDHERMIDEFICAVG